MESKHKSEETYALSTSHSLHLSTMNDLHYDVIIRIYHVVGPNRRKIFTSLLPHGGTLDFHFKIDGNYLFSIQPTGWDKEIFIDISYTESIHSTIFSLLRLYSKPYEWGSSNKLIKESNSAVSSERNLQNDNTEQAEPRSMLPLLSILCMILAFIGVLSYAFLMVASASNTNSSTENIHSDGQSIIIRETHAPQSPASKHYSSVRMEQEIELPNNYLKLIERYDDVTFYWTPCGKSYHSTLDCPSLSRSTTIYSGSLEEAFDEERFDPCDRCADEYR